jgi:hypothetical protein
MARYLLFPPPACGGRPIAYDFLTGFFWLD